MRNPVRANVEASSRAFRDQLRHERSSPAEGTAPVGRLEGVSDDVERRAVGEPVGREPSDSGVRVVEGTGADLRGDANDDSPGSAVVDDSNGLDFGHGAPPMNETVSPLDAALVDVRNYAVERGLTPDQLKDCFLAGVYASRIFGAGELLPSKGWQNGSAPEIEVA